jgi:hypothetical protein
MDESYGRADALGAAACSDDFAAGQQTAWQRIMENDGPIGLPTSAT